MTIDTTERGLERLRSGIGFISLTWFASYSPMPVPTEQAAFPQIELRLSGLFCYIIP